jgi:hypothetical protein
MIANESKWNAFKNQNFAVCLNLSNSIDSFLQVLYLSSHKLDFVFLHVNLGLHLLLFGLIFIVVGAS